MSATRRAADVTSTYKRRAQLGDAAPGTLSTIRRRGSVIVGLVVLVFLALAGRLYQLQVLRGPEYRDLARRQHFHRVVTPATRGSIFDRNGNLLAITVERPSLFADPARIEDPYLVAARLSGLLGKDRKALVDRLSSRGRFVWLARKVSPETAQAVLDLEIAGIGVRMEPTRTYPQGRLASHVLGFVGMDGEGLEGLEARFDSLMSGQDGVGWVEKDGRLSSPDVFYPELEGRRVVDGHDLHLTLDLWSQHVVEQELDRLFATFRPRGAVAIVLASRTGEILALACRPDFDPNRFGEFDRATYRNRALTDAFEMGSTMKPFVAAAAMQEGVAGPESTYFCENGAWRVHAGRVLHDHHAYGALTLAGIITHSSNIGIAKVAFDLGAALVHQYMTRLGFGRPTGIDLPGEATGVVRPLKDWTVDTLASVPMGHEITTTPVQLAGAFNVLAAGGVYLAPRILERAVSVEGDTTHRFAPLTTLRVFEEGVVRDWLVPLLVSVVEEGTGTKVKIDGVSVAGKTGTAQKPVDGTYGGRRYVASFVGFAPAENPELTVLVMADEPTAGGSYYGGTVAGPTAREILRRILPARRGGE